MEKGEKEELGTVGHREEGGTHGEGEKEELREQLATVRREVPMEKWEKEELREQLATVRREVAMEKWEEEYSTLESYNILPQ